MSTDRAELAADDFAAVLGGIQRVREAWSNYCERRALLSGQTLGFDHPTTVSAAHAYYRVQQKMKQERGRRSW
jgi:hypothetical protein